MASTATYNFNPAISDLTLSAFARIGIRRTELTAQHMADAAQESNLIQVELSARLPNLFAKEDYTQALTESTATYTLPSRFLAFQAAWITTTVDDVSTDRLIFPYSAYEYAAIADKTQEGSPTAYYLSTVVPPQITLWPVPDGNATYSLKGYVLRQFQDASLASGYTLDVPYRALDVWVAKLAHRLSRMYAPDKEVLRKADADEAWAVFATLDQEKVPIYINAAIGSYFV